MLRLKNTVLYQNNGAWWDFTKNLSVAGFSGKTNFFQVFHYNMKLEGAARYAGLLLAPAEGFGLWPRPFFALQAKNLKKI